MVLTQNVYSETWCCKIRYIDLEFIAQRLDIWQMWQASLILIGGILPKHL